MEKKKLDFVWRVRFTEKISDFVIKTEKSDPAYEKAFLSREEESENDFNRNTTTWD